MYQTTMRLPTRLTTWMLAEHGYTDMQWECGSHLVSFEAGMLTHKFALQQCKCRQVACTFLGPHCHKQLHQVFTSLHQVGSAPALQALSCRPKINTAKDLGHRRPARGREDRSAQGAADTLRPDVPGLALLAHAGPPQLSVEEVRETLRARLEQCLAGERVGHDDVGEAAVLDLLEPCQHVCVRPLHDADVFESAGALLQQRQVTRALRSQISQRLRQHGRVIERVDRVNDVVSRGRDCGDDRGAVGCIHEAISEDLRQLRTSERHPHLLTILQRCMCSETLLERHEGGVDERTLAVLQRRHLRGLEVAL
mmetsp:Transcript_130180/g.417779  ORF Transcript_130180/g.417779 Transcript_130180/m.417779 type:complete len:310 (-) Transcript_130180:1176-2105(-)